MSRKLVCSLATPTGDLCIEARSPAETDFYLSLVIPTYNERQNIAALVTQLTQLLEHHLPGDYELILVDDNSPDRTWELGLTLTASFPALNVMHRTTERGLSSAVIRGWQVARGQVLGVIDADLQHPPEILLQLLDELEKGADLVLASRHVEGGGVSEWSFIRRTLSRGAQMLGLIVLPTVVSRVSDPMSGYFLVQRPAIAGTVLNPKGYKILLEVLGRGNVQAIAEVGYVFQERSQGESKVTWRHYLDYLHHLLRLRSRGRFTNLVPTLAKLPMGRFVRFAIVGFSGVFVDYAVFSLLLSQLGLNQFGLLGLTVSNVIAAETAIFNNFLWNDAWTFSDIAQRQLGWQARLKRLLKFNLVCLVGVFLNTLLLTLLVELLGLSPYLAKLIAIAAVTFWNFWVNLKLSWRVTEVKK
ncbi:MAG: glycosyltransferase [Cyanobacteria bacterium P01_H01_bin.58]